MKFLIDRCAGRLLADWLRNKGHDVVRLPNVPARDRQLIMQDLLTRYEADLQDAAIVTVTGGRIRISKGPKQN